MSSSDNHLLSMETLDRTSPELWPEPIPGMAEFELSNSSVNNDTKPPWMAEFNNEDWNLMHHYGRVSLADLITEVRRIQDEAYQLGMEEAKEMTRGRYLNALQRRRR